MDNLLKYLKVHVNILRKLSRFSGFNVFLLHILTLTLSNSLYRTHDHRSFQHESPTLQRNPCRYRTVKYEKHVK